MTRIAMNSSLLSSFSSDHSSSSFSFPSVIRMPGFVSDCFIDFLVAFFTRDLLLLKSVVAIEPLFWDAFLLLAELTDEFIEVSGPLSIHFYMILKIVKDIDPPSSVVSIFGNFCDKPALPYELDKSDRNLYAAFLFCSGESDKSFDVFYDIFIGNNSGSVLDLRFFQMFAEILYSKHCHKLELLAEALSCESRETPEVCAILGINEMKKGLFEKAKSLFIKSLSINWSADVVCMLGHSFIRLGQNEDASRCFVSALQCNEKNFRILYTVAQGFFMIESYDRCLFYCKKALVERVDGSVWKLMGKAIMKKGNPKRALLYFEKAAELGERDALLYSAEYLRKAHKIEEAVLLYERYAQHGSQNKEAVVRYLADYYEQIGEIEKSQQFRTNTKN